MKTPPSFLLIVAALLFLASPLVAASSPMWQFPSDGDVFGKSTAGAVKANEGVGVIVEVPRSIPSGDRAEIFAGTTSLGYAYNSENTGPRRFQTILSIFTTMKELNRRLQKWPGIDLRRSYHRGRVWDSPRVRVKHRHYRQHNIPLPDAERVGHGRRHRVQIQRTVRIEHTFWISGSA